MSPTMLTRACSCRSRVRGETRKPVLGSRSAFWVCSARWLISTTTRPRWSVQNGNEDAYGYPGTFSDCVASTPLANLRTSLRVSTPLVIVSHFPPPKETLTAEDAEVHQTLWLSSAAFRTGFPAA